jgi:Divergent InlB B-repeat domain
MLSRIATLGVALAFIFLLLSAQPASARKWGHTVYAISASVLPAAGGKVSGSGTFPAGTLRTVAAVANGGYRFLSWAQNGSVVSTSASYSFMLNSNVSLTANFAALYSIAVSASPDGGGVVTGGGTFPGGTTQAVTAIANSGYTFVNWTQSGSVVSTSASYTFALNSSVVLVANFVSTYSLSVSASPSSGGIVIGGGTFAAGSTQKVSATANSSYSFVNWTQSGVVVSTSASYTLTLTGNITLAANFAPMAAQYSITVSASPGADGTVAGGGSFAAGSTQTVTAAANSGYSFINWTTNGSVASTSASYTFTLNNNVTLVANFMAGSGGNDPTAGVLPPYDDVYANWANAGMQSVGGIPSRTTICATVNPLGGGQDDFTNIQNAINSCPAGQVVQLGGGAFSVHMADLPIRISTGITLRGTGNCSGSSSPYCQTSISVADGALAYTGGKCGTSTSSEVTCPNGGPSVIQVAPVNPGYNYSWAKCGNAGLGTGCGATLLTTDAAQGQTTVQVASTSGFSVGQWVLIDEASGAGWVADPLNQWTGYGSVWAASDWLSPSGSPATGRVMWSKSQNGSGWDFGSTFPYQTGSVGCWHSYCDRPTAELHKIASIGTGTLTFDDPLTIAFRQSGSHNAQVYGGLYPNQQGSGSPISFLQNASVENLSVLRGVNGGIGMQFCAYCWIKNTEVGYWYGGGIEIAYSARSELNNVYVHHSAFSVNNGGEYPIALDEASTEILITNSITNFGGKGMVARAGGAGSVVSYSYVDDTMYDAQSGIGDYWVDMGLNASHYSGPHHVLFEGNWADNMDNDHTHGNSMYMTFFRNQGTGLRTPFTDPSNGDAVNDATGLGFGVGQAYPTAPGPLRAAGPSAYNYWFAFVGNVLGTSGVTTAANGWSYQGDWSGKRIFMLGWNDGPGGQDPHLNGASGSYLFRHGNYDYVTSSAQWDASTPDHTLPNSFYLSSAPSFFGASTSCTYPWPWVTPTGSTQIQTNSCGGSGLPAKARWDAGSPFMQP